MQLTINKKNLHMVKSVPAGMSNINPMTEMLLLDAQEDKLVATGTDMMSIGIASCEAKIKEKGICCVNAKMFLGIINNLKDDDILIKENKKHLVIQQGLSEFSFVKTKHEDFPEIPKVDFSQAVDVNLKRILTLQKVVGETALKNISTPVLGGIYLKLSPQGLVSASTDRLRITEFKTTDAYPDTIETIVPVPLFSPLMSHDADDPVKLVISRDKIAFRYHNLTVIGLTVAGAYPKYQKFFDIPAPDAITFNRKELLSALKQANLVVDNILSRVTVDIKKEQAIIRSESQDVGQIKVETVCNNPQNLEFSFAINIEFLLAIARHITSESIKLCLKAPEPNQYLNTNLIITGEPASDNECIRWLVAPIKPKGGK